jgi:hypothetical protein
MMENVVPFTLQPELMPGQQLRTYPDGSEDTAQECADLLEKVVTLYEAIARFTGKGGANRYLQRSVFADVQNIRWVLIQHLFSFFDPTGMQLCDVSVGRIGIIKAVIEADDHEGHVVVEPGGSRDWDDFIDGLLHYALMVRKPGSERDYDHALIEAVRRRVEARQ